MCLFISKFVLKTKAMKALSHRPLILTILLLCFLSIGVQSCINKEDCYDQSLFEMTSAKEQPVVDFKLLDCLDESNQKTIELSSIIFDITKDVKTLQLLVQIKKNHLRIENDLKKITKKNLILIPQISHHIYLNHDSVKSKKGNIYVLKTLEKELTNQITVFDHIEKSSQNIDFRLFAIKYKKTTNDNNEVLLNIIKSL
jgi:hypothetical protein